MNQLVPCLLFLLLFFVTPAGAQQQPTLPAAPEKLIRKVQDVYADHCCFHANFDQLTVNVAMDMKDRFKGVMYVKRPGSIALDVESPEKQKVVIRGRQYEVYFPADGNATKGEIPPEINLDHFFSFFANVGKLNVDFNVQIPPRSFDKAEKLLFLELTDKKNPSSTYRILLGIDSERFTIRRAIIYDALGNYNRFDLSDITFVPSIPESRFQISPKPTGLINPSISSPPPKEK